VDQNATTGGVARGFRQIELTDTPRNLVQIGVGFLFALLDDFIHLSAIGRNERHSLVDANALDNPRHLLKRQPVPNADRGVDVLGGVLQGSVNDCGVEVALIITASDAPEFVFTEALDDFFDRGVAYYLFSS